MYAAKQNKDEGTESTSHIPVDSSSFASVTRFAGVCVPSSFPP